MKLRVRLPAGAGRTLLAAVAALGALAPPALAQHQGDGFLFRQPTATFTVRMGFSRPLASGDPYGFFTNELTLSKASFGAFSLAGDVGVRAGERVDLVFSLGWDGSDAPSEMRHWLDPQNQPIRQTTTLARVPLTVSVKYYLASRGRAVGRFVWVPSGAAPYVGAGGGLLYYYLHQWGNFVDFKDSTIFADDYKSSDWTATAHVFAGVDVPLGPRFVLSGEARYAWAKGALSSDFSNFDKIDLSGFAVTVGMGVRF